jgi:hypothetical protein
MRQYEDLPHREEALQWVSPLRVKARDNIVKKFSDIVFAEFSFSSAPATITTCDVS